MSFKTDYARAHGWGSAHDGVHHFWVQRVTAVALIPLTVFFVFPFAGALGSGHEAVLATYRNGWNAFIAISFVAVSLYHLKLGLQVIIEDYVHSKPLRLTCLLANIILNGAFGIAGVFAIAKIAFGA
ncbi:MAG: succinate dehydrogenase, hydrophobic membrane anchor protein [Paracoccaceae bacterium]